MQHDTLVDRLRRHAACQPDATALRFLDGDTVSAELSYAALDARIRAVAATLQAENAHGERAVLLFPSSIDYVVAFHACLYAGIIAVPAYPPESRKAQHVERLAGILRDAQPRFILTTTALSEPIAAALPPGETPRIIAVDAIPDTDAGLWREHSPDPDSIAFLQYTSGSTSAPKGVCVSHANLDANECAITAGFGMVPEDVMISWLPLYHDMGLIGGLLQPLHLGIPTVLMAPTAFIEQPRRWLEAISRHGGTISGGPDFAYALASERIGDSVIETLDLSTWRLAFSGSEFVRAETLDRFARRFEPAGFARKAYCASYGLAEATLFVASAGRGNGATIGRFDADELAAGRVSEAGSEASNGSLHVAIGHPAPDHAVAIMRPDGTGPSEADGVGEIWFSGPSVAGGYWRNAEATRAAFVRHDGRDWLRTGDLGFLREGLLTVTGRVKDMLIVRGQNIYPQDVEAVIEAELEMVRRGRVAAYPVEIDGREAIGIAAEFGRGTLRLVAPEALQQAIAEAVIAQAGESPAVVVLLNPRGMPLTTSGKLQRSACAANWAKGGLDAFATFVKGRRLDGETPQPERAAVPSSEPASGIEAIVAEIWISVLRVAEVGPADDFFLLGGNSLAAAEAAAALRERCGIECDLADFYRQPNLRAFARLAEERQGSAQPRLPPIAAADRARALPLSHAQERLWFLWQMSPASTAYTVAGAIRLHGRLDGDALLLALQGIVDRHEALRTTFEAGEGGASQRIHHSLPIPTWREDLSAMPEAARAASVEALTQAALALPFDLANGPLVRASLIRLSESEHELLVTAHHIVADGVSMGVLLDELGALYRGIAPSTSPEIHYADFAVWQRDWLASGEGERQLAYWRATLGNEHPVLELPLDRPRPTEQSHRGDTVAVAIASDLAERLRALARAERTSVFTVLHAAYALLLNRYCGTDDIRIGVPTANRRLKAVEGLIGFFVNTLVLRLKIERRESFAALLAKARQVSVDALAHQDLPFERLVEKLAPERSLAHNPLFQAKFNYMAAPRGFEAVDGLDVDIRILDLAGAHFDLALDIVDGPQGMKASFNYATDLFDRETIEGIAAQFRDFLGQATRDPARLLSEFALLDAGRNALAAPLHAFRASDFLDLSGAALLRDPRATALVDASGALTYAQLDAHSDAVAADLLARCLRPEVPVALLIERSNAFVAGLIGIMKVGAVAVPLDPAWPAARIRDILDSAGIDLVLAAGETVTTARETGRAFVDLGEIAPLEAKPALPEAHPEQAAYVIYTSGSTGKPKGVVVSRRALANYVQTLLDRLGPEPGAAMAMVSTVAADLGHTVLFGALAAGASLHLFSRETAFDAAAFAARMRHASIETLKIVPSHLRGLLQAEPSGDVLPSRLLILGGEALDPTLVAEIRRLRPALRILNHYGPTETTVGALTHAVDAAETAVPIGTPLANLRAHILDAALEPVPGGVAGELFIGGAGLARGYLGNAAATAERFVPDPFGSPGARLYRTGDRARRDREGRVHFRGRADDQIKLRGYRIEPAEIARRLSDRDDVGEAMVLVQTMPDNGTAQLVAYVTAAPNARPDPAALKEALAQALPDHMVPSHLVVLERMPLTANGKLDRKALPLPEATGSANTKEKPANEIEQAIAEVWAQVLRRDGVGVTDNFFELGGDSILSLQVIARLRKRGIKLTPKQIVEKQTVRGLASVAVPAKPPAPKPTLSPATQPAIALLPIQDRFFAEVTLDRHHWNQSLLLVPRERLEVEPLRRALHALVSHHEALRYRFSETGGSWTATIAQAADRPEILRHESAADDATLAALCAAAQASLDLGAGRLVQALLVDRPDGGQRLLIAIHHLAIDGVSWRILLEDLHTAYGQAKAGGPIALGVGTETHAGWSARLRQLAASEGLAAQLPFWTAQSEGIEADLPSDRVPQEAETLADAQTFVTRLGTALTSRLLEQAPVAYRTQVNDLLLAALARALADWTGRDASLIELEGHGREDASGEADLSRSVGWFTTTFPVRLDGAAGDTAALVKRIKEGLRALPNRGLGHGLLARFGRQSQRTALAALPQPNVTFNYLGQLDSTLSEEAGFALADEDGGPGRSLSAPLSRPLVIDAAVREGALQLSWRYGCQRYDRATIERLAEGFSSALREIVDHCTGGAAGLTPSDVPLCGLDQAGLDASLAGAGLDPREVEDVYPLSPIQAGILFHVLGDESARDTYVSQLAVTIEGRSAERLRSSWQAATRRHPALRTGIHWRGIAEAGLQVVERDPPLSFTIEDGRGASDATLAGIAREERAKGFDLDNPPLQRVRLIRLDDTPDGQPRHRLVWTSHHILTDGWSSARLLAEILGEGREASVPSALYRDYIAWLGQRDEAASQAFWRDQLAPLDEPTLIAEAFLAGFEPLSNPRPHPQVAARSGALEGDLQKTSRSLEVSFEAASAAPQDEGELGNTETNGQSLTLAGDDFTALAGFAQRERVTLNTVLQGAWALALRKLSHGRSIAFGATVAGRPAELAGAQEMLGLFINTLPVVDAAPPDRRTGDWLRDLQARNAALREHEHTPLHHIQRYAGRRGQALFDSILVYENYPIDQALTGGGPKLSDIAHASLTNYALTITAVPSGDRLDLEFERDSSRLSAEQAGALRDIFAGLLAALTEDAERPIGLVGGVSLAATAAALPAVETQNAEPVHALFAREARSRPDAEALSSEGVSLSYSALDARANRLAHRLIGEGVGPGEIVGVAMARSVDLVVALVAVLKAGAAYLPLDPGNPAARLAHALSDSGARLLLTDAASSELLPGDVCPVLVLDDLDLWGEPESDPGVSVHPEDLAYVIYTSGSTGIPKGVAVAHGPFAMHCAAAAPLFGLDATGRELLFASFAFDASHERLWSALTTGASLVLRDEALWSPERTLAVIAEQGITHADLPPSYLQEVASFASWRGDVPKVDLYSFGGEAMPRAGFERVAGSLRSRLFINGYGPTEAVVTPLAWKSDGSSSFPGPSAPIGSVVGARSAHVLDGDGQPVPDGVTGELYLGGYGLARGYLGRAGLTGSRFVPDPYGAPGSRLYRTGDLACRLPDGVFLYRGRVDDQVKIRGHRIEPGEVEARLLALPGVGQAAVVAREGAGGALQLVGYAAPASADGLCGSDSCSKPDPHPEVPKRSGGLEGGLQNSQRPLEGSFEAADAAPQDEGARGIDGAALRAALAETLPDYMVPTAVVVLERLPLTANGKLDRRALPAPDLAGSDAYVAPSTEAETVLAAIWCAVLGLDRVGVTDNFFELGGDSIQAIRVVSRLRERLEQSLSPKDLFERPTIALLAQGLGDGEASSETKASRLDALLSEFEDA